MTEILTNYVSRALDRSTLYKEFGLSTSHDSKTVLFFQKYAESTDVITQTHVSPHTKYDFTVGDMRNP